MTPFVADPTLAFMHQTCATMFRTVRRLNRTVSFIPFHQGTWRHSSKYFINLSTYICIFMYGDWKIRKFKCKKYLIGNSICPIPCPQLIHTLRLHTLWLPTTPCLQSFGRLQQTGSNMIRKCTTELEIKTSGYRTRCGIESDSALPCTREWYRFGKAQNKYTHSIKFKPMGTKNHFSSTFFWEKKPQLSCRYELLFYQKQKMCPISYFFFCISYSSIKSYKWRAHWTQATWNTPWSRTNTRQPWPQEWHLKLQPGLLLDHLLPASNCTRKVTHGRWVRITRG